MIGRDQAKINTLIVSLKSKPGGCAVQMAVVALLHAVLLQQFYDWRAGIPGGHRRIMKKNDLFSVPCRLQRHTNTPDFPGQHFLVLGLRCVLKEPAPAAAQSHIAVRDRLLMQNL